MLLGFFPVEEGADMVRRKKVDQILALSILLAMLGSTTLYAEVIRQYGYHQESSGLWPWVMPIRA